MEPLPESGPSCKVEKFQVQQDIDWSRVRVSVISSFLFQAVSLSSWISFRVLTKLLITAVQCGCSLDPMNMIVIVVDNKNVYGVFTAFDVYKYWRLTFISNMT